MPWLSGVLVALAVSLAVVVPARAQDQDQPPRIGPIVIDLHGVVPKFGNPPGLAESRGLDPAEIPGVGLGASAAIHIYLPKILGIRIGLGGEAMIGRSHFAPPPAVVDPTTGVSTPSTLRPVTETFKEISPQLSLNFGGINGWSYLSAGVGRAIWSVTPDGTKPLPQNEDILNSFNYGGGARWFMKKHLAFSLDIRLYDIGNGIPQLGFIGGPRSVLFVIGGGISLK